MCSSSESDSSQSNSRWPAKLSIEKVYYPLLESLFVDLHITAKVLIKVVPFLIDRSVASREDFPILRWEDYFFDKTGGET